jgi:hypothetical protein
MLVSGSLESSAGDGFSFKVSLEEVASQRPVWTDRFAGTARDLFTLVDQISAGLIRALHVQGEQTASVLASGERQPGICDGQANGSCSFTRGSQSRTHKAGIH